MNRNIMYVIGGVALAAVLFFGYSKYAHITCTESARDFTNENKSGKSVSDAQKLYDLSYTICMGKRGL